MHQLVITRRVSEQPTQSISLYATKQIRESIGKKRPWTEVPWKERTIWLGGGA